jgi:hypothetical protein
MIKNKIILLVFLGLINCSLVASDKDGKVDGKPAATSLATLGVVPAGFNIDQRGLGVAAAAIADQATHSAITVDYDGDKESDSDGFEGLFPDSKPLTAVSSLASSLCRAPGVGTGAPTVATGAAGRPLDPALLALAESDTPENSDLI